MIILPGQFARRSDFYQQLGQLTAAGLGLDRALEQLERHPPGRSYQEPIRRLRAELSAGCTFTDALRRLGNWLPAFDVALIGAGEQSGRLDLCFRLLADYYSDRAQMARQMIADLAYPVALCHFAIFIFPFAQFFTSGDWSRYLAQTFGILLPVYALVLLVIYAAQSRHGEHWRSTFEAVLHPVPILGQARRCLALARLAAALEALLNAGVTIIEGWEIAAGASGSPALRRVVLGWRAALDGGVTPSEAINRSRQFPDVFANLYAAGEVSGTLDETLQRLHLYYQEEGRRKLHALAQWLPRLLYLAIVLAIAVKIVMFWSGYFQQIQQVM